MYTCACACAGKRVSALLTNCNVERGRLERFDRSKICLNDCERVAVNSNVDPVVNTHVDETDSVRLSRCQGSDCVLATRT